MNNIVRYLFERTTIARFNSTPNTSIRHYIDYSCVFLINNAFDIIGSEELFVGGDIRENDLI